MNPEHRGVAIAIHSNLATAAVSGPSLPVGILVADGFDEQQFCSAMKAFQSAGCETRIVSTRSGLVTGALADRSGHSFMIDLAAKGASADDFHALFVPGGEASVQRLTQDEDVGALLADARAAGKPVGVVCEGVWLLGPDAAANETDPLIRVQERTVSTAQPGFGREAAERLLGLADG